MSIVLIKQILGSWLDSLYVLFLRMSRGCYPHQMDMVWCPTNDLFVIVVDMLGEPTTITFYPFSSLLRHLVECDVFRNRTF